LLRLLQVRNWAVVAGVNFIGFIILGDEELDQLLGIMGASCVNTSADLIGTTLVRGTKLSSSVIHFLRGTLILFTQWG
jgi:hypothetical protein